MIVLQSTGSISARATRRIHPFHGPAEDETDQGVRIPDRHSDHGIQTDKGDFQWIHRSVAMGSPDLGSGMLDVIEVHEGLAWMPFLPTTVFDQRENPMLPGPLSILEEQDLVVEEIGCVQARPLEKQLGESYVGTRDDGRLLVDPAHTLYRVDIASILVQKEGKMGAQDLPVRFLFGLLQDLYLGLG